MSSAPLPAPTAPTAEPRSAHAAPWVVGIGMAILAAVHFRHGQDFTVYWTAGRRLIAGEALYRSTEVLAYRYAPGAACLFVPLAPLPRRIAQVIWLAGLVGVGVAVARRMLRSTGGPRRGTWVLLAFLAGVRPVLEELACAQANIVALWLLLLAFEAEDRGREVRAGLLAALAVGLKLGPIVMAADWVLRRRFRPLVGLALGLIGLGLATVPFYGVAGTLAQHREWLQLQGAASPELIRWAGNQSLFSLTARLGLPPAAGALAAAAAVALALAARAPQPRRSLLLLCLALSTPLGWVQNYVFALPALLRVVSSGRAQAWLAGAFGVASLLPMHDLGGPRMERWVLDHSLLTLCMLAFFALAARAVGRQPQALDTAAPPAAAL